MVARESIPQPAVRAPGLSDARRGSRSWGALASFAVHAVILLAISFNVAPRRLPEEREREPVVLHLPRALRPPAATPAPPKRRKPVKARPAVEPQVIPPPDLAPPPEPEMPAPVSPAAGESDTETAASSALVAESDAGWTGPERPADLGFGDGPLTLGDVARPPRVLVRVTPTYPRQARRDHIEGLVLLRVIIDRDGRVESGSVEVVRSVAALDEAACAALAGWRFSPAIDRRGQPVRVIVEIPFEFVLG